MKHYLLFITFLIISINTQAQAPAIQWQKSLGGSLQDAANADANAVWQTTDGGYIVAGESYSSDGQVTGHHGSNDSDDYWIVKLNDTGGIQWEKSLGGSGREVANAIQQTTDGGYIVAGFSTSDDGDVTGNHGGTDSWIVKLNDTGGIVWQKSLGGSGDDDAFDIHQTLDGGYIIAGNTSSDDGQVSGNHGNDDYWVVKINDTGGIQWQKCYGGSANDDCQSVKQTADGGYIVAGTAMSSDMEVTGSHLAGDYWIVKLNDTGGMQWEKCYGGSSLDEANDIIQTMDGGYIVAGQTTSSDGDVTGFHGGLYEDYWTVKLNDTGGIQWEKCYGGSDDDLGFNVIQTADSGYVLGGWSSSTDGDVTGYHGNPDYWVLRVNDTGAIIWENCYGGTGFDEAFGMIQTIDGAYVIFGNSNSTSGEVTGNHGGVDYWAVKLNCNPGLGTISGATALCPDSMTTLIDTSAGGVWSVSNSHASISGGIVTGVTTGSDTVIYAVTNGCGTEKTFFPLAVSACISEATHQIPAIDPVKISPNPTTGDINVTGANIGNIRIYNTLGQLVAEARTGNTSISGFPAGLYFVFVYKSDGSLMKQARVIKE